MLKILFLGDVIGEPGRRAVIDTIPKFKEERGVDFVIVNGENSANGRGITPRIAIDLLRAGAAVITSGDHIWDQKDIVPYMDIEPRLLRPLNYPDGPAFVLFVRWWWFLAGWVFYYTVIINRSTHDCGNPVRPIPVDRAR